MKSKINKNLFKNKKYIYCYLIIFLLLLFLNIGFSAFQNKLSIENTNASVKIDKDVRVTNVGVDSTNTATSYYNEYNASNISGRVKLDNETSYVIYDVEIHNLGNVPVGISSASIDNENLKFEFLDYNLKEKICENNQCSLGVKKKIKVKISYKDETNINNEANNFILTFKFGRIFNITYYNISNSDKFPTEIIEGDSLNLNIPNKEDFLIKKKDHSI